MEMTEALIQDLIEMKEKMAVVELQYKYVRSVDERDWKTSVGVFHSEGKLWVVTTEQKKLIGGLPEIEAFYKEIAVRDFIFARHFITNPVIKVDRDHASFISYYNTLFIHDTLTRVIFGFYDDKLVKENGEWRILEKQIIMGWNNNLVPLKELLKK
jgi:3-phenylpropionate/cinnamic acid dioxygenase small subunit